MDERSKAVLRAAVETYISSAEPVASRALGRQEIRLSSASIRSIMARLEQSGFLYQPHTSAGRIPTNAGYRTYVDELMAPVVPGARAIESFRSVPRSGVRPRMEGCAAGLAQATGLTAFAVSAVRDEAVHRHVEFVRLRRGEILGIVATQSGTVHHRMVTVDTDIPQSELDRLQNFLNTRFEGLTLREIRRVMREELVAARRSYHSLRTRAFELGERTLPTPEEPEVDIVAVGHHKLLDQPEFASAAAAMPVLEELERRETWLALLDNVSSAPGLTVIIGTENMFEGLHQCSVVATSLHWEDGVDGTVGLVGPTRLAYAQVTTLIQFLAQYVIERATRGHSRLPT